MTESYRKQYERFPFPVDKFGNFDDFLIITPLLNYLPFGALDGATKVGPSFRCFSASI